MARIHLCGNCGKPMFKMTATMPLPAFMTPQEYWTHVTDGGGDTDCHLSAEKVPTRAAIAVPSGFSERERDEFIGRLENCADSIADDIAAERAL